MVIIDHFRGNWNCGVLLDRRDPLARRGRPGLVYGGVALEDGRAEGAAGEVVCDAVADRAPLRVNGQVGAFAVDVLHPVAAAVDALAAGVVDLGAAGGGGVEARQVVTRPRGVALLPDVVV